MSNDVVCRCDACLGIPNEPRYRPLKLDRAAQNAPPPRPQHFLNRAQPTHEEVHKVRGTERAIQQRHCERSVM